MKKYYQIITETINFSQLPSDFDPSDEGQEVEKTIGNTEAKLLLSRLTSRQRQVIQLRIDKFSFKEIGEQVGVSEENARKIKQRVKEKLNYYVN